MDQAKSPVANVSKSFHDDYIKENARFRSRAGLKCFIVRTTDGKCCKWCTAMAGRYEYGSEPHDVYRRHDNCGCTVIYESGRQRQDVWTKKTWEVPEGAKKKYEPVRLSPERAKTLQQAKLSQYRGLTSGGGSGIIEAERMQSSSDYAVPKHLTSSRRFRSKFDSMDTDVDVQRQFYHESKEMLKRRSGTDGEDLLYYNTRTRKWYRSTEGTTKGRPDYNAEILRGLEESNRDEIVAFHNHPLGMPPSDGDLNAALLRGYKKGYTIGHNGTIFEYTQPKYRIPEEVYNRRVGAYKEDGCSDFEAQLHALEDLRELYEFEFREVKSQ